MLLKEGHFMKRSLRQRHLTDVLFLLMLVLFFAFFIYIAATAQVSAYRAGEPAGYQQLTAPAPELQADDTAPAGVRKVYALTAPGEGTLLFNIAHHEIAVYLDGRLVYRLTAASGSPIARNVGSNWCAVDAAPGQAITVELTPLFQAAMEKNPEFLFGSQNTMTVDILRQELPGLVLAALCILLGMFVLAAFVYFHLRTSVRNTHTAYLGVFSILLGLWKMADLKAITLLLPDSSAAMGYISVGSLFLTGPCLMLHFSTLFTPERRRIPRALFTLGALTCLTALAMQVLGLGELRQNLVFSHILLVLAILLVPVVAVWNRLVHRDWGIRPVWRMLLLVLLGIVFDLLLYYRNNENSALSFSIVGFVIYMMVVFFRSIQTSTRKSYTDSHTGLINRTRWNEVMHGEISLPERYGMAVFDMNGLKHINDTLGHDAGDQSIYRFSAILRDTLPRKSMICRWGGDEFAAIIPCADRTDLEKQLALLRTALEKYNTDHPELPISVATGTALSADHPTLSPSDLFRLADEEMYRNKQTWYARQ